MKISQLDELVDSINKMSKVKPIILDYEKDGASSVTLEILNDFKSRNINIVTKQNIEAYLKMLNEPLEVI